MTSGANFGSARSLVKSVSLVFSYALPDIHGRHLGLGKDARRYRCRRAARSDRSGMLPQFIDEDPRVLAVVYGDRDQLHAALLKSPLERRHQPLGGLDPGAARVMSARERDEIRVSERHAEIGKAVGRLLPADHAVGVARRN